MKKAILQFSGYLSLVMLINYSRCLRLAPVPTGDDRSFGCICTYGFHILKQSLVQINLSRKLLQVNSFDGLKVGIIFFISVCLSEL